MRKILLGILFVATSLLMASEKVVILIHGGAGYTREDVSVAEEPQYRAGLERALQAGWKVWKSGGENLSVVEAAIQVLENDPLFNAGKGAVFNHEGKNELDASIMDGKDLRAGAVAGVTRVKNPIRAARGVMEKSPHVFMAGQGADRFAKEIGLEIVDPKYFFTEKRWKGLQELLKKGDGKNFGGDALKRSALPPARIWSTVGAVVLDSKGNLGAGTSTGGLTNKRWGRIGDSPVIGAGTYADNRGAAISATGHGEYFIRYAVAHEINSRVRHGGLSVQKAADEIIMGDLKKAGGEGGVIGLDAKGNMAASYNSETLFRGYMTEDGKMVTVLFDDQPTKK